MQDVSKMTNHEASTGPNQFRPPKAPVLRFVPTAWAKLLYMRNRKDLEVGGFGITPAHDLLLVEQFVTIRQRVTPVSVLFDDAAVADYLDEQIEAGRQPQQVMRIWIHCHPGDSPVPSATDRGTFARVFGRSDWSLMFILSRSGEMHAGLRFSVGPGSQMQIPVQVDHTQPFEASDHEAWRREYERNVWPEPDMPVAPDRDLWDTERFDPTDRLEAVDLRDADMDHDGARMPWE